MNGERDEGLVLLMLNLLSCLIAPLGLFITPIILKRNKATNTFYKLVFVAGVVSLLVNSFGLYAHLGDLFHWGGPSSVEYLGNQQVMEIALLLVRIHWFHHQQRLVAA
eukprot:TRINITY_DN58159_c0_g1_i1.p1 TRINITY_DN58159_c0_g1~~TRINITY_DN58159_c0_g1_i1.p1  ORF type:complete len:108 (-),score=1.03 TRINITY_DN58159_c0_g1_i1:232-555(-)